MWYINIVMYIHIHFKKHDKTELYDALENNWDALTTTTDVHHKNTKIHKCK